MRGPTEPEEHPDVVVCPGGPLLLRGDHVVEDVDGRRHRTQRPVSAVCRCGRPAPRPGVTAHTSLPRAQRP